MLTYNEALELIINSTNRLPAAILPLSNLLNHYLAEPVIARFELPLFDNSAVDGYGVLISDLSSACEDSPVPLKMIGAIEAGGKTDTLLPEIKPGECVKILTGAPIPSGVEAVIMKEYSHFEKRADIGLFSKSVAAGENIRRRGEEVKAGDYVAPAHARVNPPMVGLLATCGYAEFSAYRQPRIAILATGDELVEPGQDLSENQIYNSNSYAIEAACHSLGLKQVKRFHCRDTRDDTIKELQKAIDFADLIICTGGVSVGDKDLVKPVLEEEFQVETIFWRIAIKPGKPVYFARKMDKYFIALPGNPVSALVTFHLFVKPVLLLLQGAPIPQTSTRQARLLKAVRKKAGRMEFVRGIQKRTQDDNLMVEPTKGQESHMLSGLAFADCLIHFERDDEELSENSLVQMQDLIWESY